MSIYHLQEFVSKAIHRVLREPAVKAALGSCGKKVHIAQNCDFKGIENISIGNGSSIGMGAVMWTTRANINIGEKVIFGPHVTIITGNHRTDLVGKYMADVCDSEKMPENDGDVIIRNDVWIGANVTILKGVAIEEGCVIAAGAVVTKSTEPYGIYAGVPAVRIRERFTNEQLEEHSKLLSKHISYS